MRTRLSLCLSLTWLFFLAGCGSGAFTPTTPPSSKVSLVSIAVTSSNASIAVGQSEQLTATAKYSDNSTKDVTSSVSWSSSPAGVASVGQSGLMTAMAAGSVDVQANYNGMTASATLSVTDNLVSLSINASANAVNVGGSLQLTAMGTYQDGKPAQPVGGVTWSSLAASLAIVDNTGLVSGLKSGPVTVTASIGSISASIQLSVVPVLQSIVLSPIGPALLVGGQEQFHALGSYNDGSTQDLTSVANWTTSDASKASAAAGGIVTAVSVGLVTITASSSGVNGSTALNMVNSSYSSFTGPYAFTLTSRNNQGVAFFAGSISADAQGNLSGVEDSNGPAGLQQNVAVSGTSVIYPDGRGLLTFNPNACHPTGIALRFVLTSGGNRGSLIEFDGLGSAKGNLELQNPAAFNTAALDGIYVFRATGLDSGNNSTNSPQPFGMVGMFNANGAGSVTRGVEDVNDFGTAALHVPLTTSSYTVGANGRGTLQLSSGLGATNYAVYVIDPTKLLFIETDAAPANAVLGLAELQTAAVYDVSSLSGYYAFQVEQPVQVNSGTLSYFDFEQVGRFDLDGAGNMGGVRDGESMSGSYTVSNNNLNGRGMLSTQGTMQGHTGTDGRLYVFYVVSPSRLFILQCYGLPLESSLIAPVGEADVQTSAPYSSASLTGVYSMTVFDMTIQTESLMWLDLSGAGNIQGLADTGAMGTATTTVIADPQFSSATDANGLAVLQLTTPAGVLKSSLYLSSPSQAFMGTPNPPTYGLLDRQ